MGEFFLKSISDEYDDEGNYIGNSDEGNRFHGVEATEGRRVLMCAACESTSTRPHRSGVGTVCTRCGCGEMKWKYR